MDQETIEELLVLVSSLERDEALKAVLFESADPDFFIAHYDTSRPSQSSTAPGPTVHAPWLDFVLRLSKAFYESAPRTAQIECESNQFSSG